MFLLRLFEELMLLITLGIEFCVEIGEWSCLNKYKKLKKKEKTKEKETKKCTPLFIFYLFPNNSMLLILKKIIACFFIFIYFSKTI